MVDRLAKLAFLKEEINLSWEVHRRVIEIPMIEMKVNHLGPAEPKWAKEIYEYLHSGKLPEEKEAIRKIKRSIARFVKVDGILYKKGFAAPLLRCISLEEAQYVLAKIYEDIRGNHSS